MCTSCAAANLAAGRATNWQPSMQWMSLLSTRAAEAPSLARASARTLPLSSNCVIKPSLTARGPKWTLTLMTSASLSLSARPAQRWARWLPAAAAATGLPARHA
eukprot:1466835-Pyramimonas_sp.AAC.1